MSSDALIISLDAMGGINAPRSVLQGADLALNLHPDLQYIIYGDANIIQGIINSKSRLLERSQVVHTTSVILDNDSPIKALKYGKDSSMRKAIDAVKNAEAHACVSSGNTGALMVMSKMVLGMIRGISRPAIAGLMPTKKGWAVLLDMGANTECDAMNLFEFALAGSSYAKVCLNKHNPSVAILNVGSEEIKGREIDKKAYAMLKNSNLNFKGFIEGYDIVDGEIDVIVTDGFSGNLVLKASEAAAKFCLEYMRIAFKRNIWSKIGALFVKKSLKQQFYTIDPARKNGAMFLGIEGIVIKSHGSSSSEGFASAISLARDLALSKVNLDIKSEIELLSAGLQPTSHNLMGILKRTLGMEG